MVCKAGTILVPSGTYHNPYQKHLHIVCTDPDDQGRVVLVSVTTWINDLCDGTCILLEHEHPWLWKPKSYVNYRKRLMHFVQIVLNFDKMSRQIDHDLQDADGV